MSYKFFDFECALCGRVWEEMIWHKDPNPRCCGQVSTKRISTPNLAYMKMGVDPTGLPTAGEKWAAAHEKRGKTRKHNLTDV